MIDYQITAEEARNLRKNCINTELEKVFKLIRLAATNPNGNDYIVLNDGIWADDGTVVDFCINELRKLGFDVKQTISDYVDNSVKVSW